MKREGVYEVNQARLRQTIQRMINQWVNDEVMHIIEQSGVQEKEVDAII